MIRRSRRGRGPDAAPYDPGLQAERTALAWTRTAIAVLVNALLSLRTGWVERNVALMGLAGVLLVASILLWLNARRRHDALLRHPPAPPSARSIGVSTALALAACLAAVMAILAQGLRP